jgi:hypothetical protein
MTLGTGIFFLIFCLVFIFFAHFFLRKNNKTLGDPDFQLRFNSIYLNIDPNNVHGYFLTTLFLARRFFLGPILSFCDNHPYAQFVYMNLTSVIILMYLFRVRPLVTKYFNFIEIFNEVILYGCTGLIIGMTDY